MIEAPRDKAREALPRNFRGITNEIRRRQIQRRNENHYEPQRFTTCPICKSLNDHRYGKCCVHVDRVTLKNIVFYKHKE